MKPTQEETATRGGVAESKTDTGSQHLMEQPTHLQGVPSHIPESVNKGRPDLLYLTELEAVRAANEEMAHRADPIREAIVLEAVEEARVDKPDRDSTTELETTNASVHPVVDSHSALGTRCENARTGAYRGEESGNPYFFSAITCQRRNCEPCRRYLADVLADRIIETTGGWDELHMLEVANADYRAAKARLDRRGAAYVQVPANDGHRIILTDTADRDSEPLEHEHGAAYARDISRNQPVDRRRFSSSTNADGTRLLAKPRKADPAREKLVYEGTFSQRHDADEIERLAAERGLPAERIKLAFGAEMVRLLAHWNDPRAEYVRRCIGFTPRKADDEGPPLEAYWAEDRFLKAKHLPEQYPIPELREIA